VAEHTVIRSWKATTQGPAEPSTLAFIKVLENGNIYAVGKSSNLVLWTGERCTELSAKDTLVETIGLTHNGKEAIVLIRTKETGSSHLEFYKESTRTGYLKLE
jgi:hypothetical protein